ncbi:RNA-guided endonuclease InsQ/TnpB family protein [Cutibacterium acnes]|uniref:RNA-guided endonuclease InsQ/TnpB family protein n=1 Tax=Cutibacterium acnes TaxID=1747 RepID=UPI00255B0682|nr:transposase [Cutibacterium acnes]
MNVQAMMTRGGAHKRGLNRAIAQASFADLRRRITYKTRWNGGRTVIADRWFSSSKTCSECGEVKSKLSLSEREYICHRCGVVVDRDLNAATNLARLAAPKSGVDFHGTGSSPGMGRGGAGKTSSSSGELAPAGEASMARKDLSGRKAGTR